MEMRDAQLIIREEEGKGTIENKAGYTATLVACGWARAVMKLTN